MGFYDHLRQIRLLKGITQSHVAKHIHVSPSTYCHIENGRRSIKVELIKPLAEALGVKPQDLFAD